MSGLQEPPEERGEVEYLSKHGLTEVIYTALRRLAEELGEEDVCFQWMLESMDRTLS